MILRHGGGSYGNRQISAGYHSGRLPGDFAFYTRLSFLENDGFRDNSATRQRNVFFSASKPVGSAELRRPEGVGVRPSFFGG